MRENQVERVARAICRAEIQDAPLGQGVTLDMMVDTIWRDWESPARSAISAMEGEKGVEQATRSPALATAPSATEARLVARYADAGDPPSGFQRDHAHNSGLSAEGDCVLIWINEGDLCALELAGLAIRFPRPKAEGLTAPAVRSEASQPNSKRIPAEKGT